jgi:hypothetical protein
MSQMRTLTRLFSLSDGLFVHMAMVAPFSEPETGYLVLALHESVDRTHDLSFSKCEAAALLGSGFRKRFGVMPGIRDSSFLV